MRTLIIQALLFISATVFSQQTEISAVLADAQTKEIIPYATIQYGENKGVLTNDEGVFVLPEGISENNKIKVSSLGYEETEMLISELKDTLFIKPSSITLTEVFLSDKDLSGEEILEKVLANIDSNYNFNYAKKRFFYRSSYFNDIKRMDMEVEESTIPEIDQKFVNNALTQIPRYVDSYMEYLGDFYGNYEDQKVQVIKIANLYNPTNEQGVEELGERMEQIIKDNLGEDTYVKIKSGLLGFKMDSEEFLEEMEEAEEPKEKTAEEKTKDSIMLYENLANGIQSKLLASLKGMFWKDDITFDVFQKSRKYEFEVEGYTQIGNDIAYVINFKPKRGADFKGKMFVSTEDFGLYRLDYDNVKPLKKFKLFGVSNKKDVFQGKMIFAKDKNDKYNLKYVERSSGNTFGVSRPLKILVKKGKWYWNKRLKELDLEMDIVASDVSKGQWIIYDEEEMDKEAYASVEVNNQFDYKKFKKYNAEFWDGYNVMEPNQAIKSFSAMDEAEDSE
ncbi:carboxypeptidase-like regulatory domain-containing protein [Zunongwangia sp. HRR-M8]|uniref:carboxypeptidase-like regulatory domain-containing protein n=1 Tax=Zunongwangia sp. HRR-M8 TaxID=3015170 RepID=UPI0022DD2BDC|nr:carboxypeptidase-like regulatory domain-containing protein [Zunongwangia sp. HRR-M8]WBL22921.1 hypothetical protein PBT89_02930 [Zunongwangia sp. HRR-M8]